jgi:NADH dehydrogenase
MGGVGQINPVQTNLRDLDSVRRAAQGADAVVNLVGILFQRGKQKFTVLQAEGAARVAEVAAEIGAGSMVHLSAIGADPASKSLYARSKAAGEDAVMKAFPAAVVLRPSIVFGPEDDFFNRFAAMARISPFLPLIGGGETRFQPVYVGDVAKAVVAGLEGEARPGTTYELGGPEILSFKELMQFVLETTQRNRLLLPLPVWLAKVQAVLFSILPRPPITLDQIYLLDRDNVVSEAAIAQQRTLAALGVEPVAIETAVPGYLERFRPKGQFSRRFA